MSSVASEHFTLLKVTSRIISKERLKRKRQRRRLLYAIMDWYYGYEAKRPANLILGVDVSGLHALDVRWFDYSVLFQFQRGRKAYNKETADIGRPIPLRGLIRGTNNGRRRFYELNQQCSFFFMLGLICRSCFTNDINTLCGKTEMTTGSEVDGA